MRICVALDEAIDNYKSCVIILNGVSTHVLPILRSAYSNLPAFLDVCSNIDKSMEKIFEQRHAFPRYLDNLEKRIRQLLGDQSQLCLSSSSSLSAGDEINSESLDDIDYGIESDLNELIDALDHADAT